jgi:hypothetical protein
MPHERTDPVQTPPPPVGAWDVVFSRKRAAAAGSDPDWIDTGHAYDGGFEYLCGTGMAITPTPNNSAPAVLGSARIGTASYAVYKPDGSTSFVIASADLAIISIAQDLSVLSGAVGVVSNYASIRVQPSGLFETKWVDMLPGEMFPAHDNYDGHWFIARRRRYG